MAYYGGGRGAQSRGSGSGDSRGRGGYRGRGSGRGFPTGAGRGRGTGGFRGRGRGKPVFDSARIAQKEGERNEDSESETPSEEQQEIEDSESSDEEDIDSVPGMRPYELLLKTFASEQPSHAKRRKLDHVEKPKVAENRADRALEDEMPDSLAELELDNELEGNFESETDSISGDEEEVEDASDPFETHFANPNDNILARRLNAIQKGQWYIHKAVLPNIGKATIGLPQTGDPNIPSNLPVVSGPKDLNLKQKLSDIIIRPHFDALERTMAPRIFNYQDVMYCERTSGNQENLRRLVCLHAINHIFKTRDRVIRNNARRSKDEENDDLDLRDQGFTRPKILMILPTRESCVRMINMIKSLCAPEQEENRKRFDDFYVKKEDDFAINKAEDFRELFGGNDDDDFRLGLKFTRKTIKYFSQFYNSDIIFSSALGLRNAIHGTVDTKGHQKRGDYDYLSSIEVVIVDQADAIYMQNWENVKVIFEHLNLQPKETHGCDFSRVRNWYLDNQAPYFRQTIALSAFNTPEMNALLFHRSKNWAGKVRVNNVYSGVISKDLLGVKAKQTFSRFEASSIVREPDDRFEYFTKAIVPTLTRRTKDAAGTVIFIPSSLDFARVRNHFAKSTLSFASIDEYTDVKDIARARSHFLNGRHTIILYTERAHHFLRYALRGVKKVIMYGLPENPIFYKEIVGGCLSRSTEEGRLGPGDGSMRAIFSKLDQMKLERIVGTERLERMLKEKGDTFDFL